MDNRTRITNFSKMNNTLTPETDEQTIIYAINDNGYQVPCVDIDFARKLERERDEAREDAMRWEKLALREASKLGEIICGKVIEK
jgi:hypothetical protein